MWGHGSSNCNLPANCVKFAGAHDSVACEVSSKGTKVPEDKPTIMGINAKKSMRKPDLLEDQPPPTSDLRADHHLTSTR
jgi:hypothetical protein